eukprot:TRINITY_DN5374_c0_g1_i2.p1 TRINITY_DN5374_c0_g1~~TRINITY_DN5374_c0_g1_i2.p1  ORF type:complete len:271 (-),score=53.45 TRINITY_DN5374_c0_g1_i2:96-908(-)
MGNRLIFLYSVLLRSRKQAQIDAIWGYHENYSDKKHGRCQTDLDGSTLVAFSLMSLLGVPSQEERKKKEDANKKIHRDHRAELLFEIQHLYNDPSKREVEAILDLLLELVRNPTYSEIHEVSERPIAGLLMKVLEEHPNSKAWSDMLKNPKTPKQMRHLMILAEDQRRKLMSEFTYPERVLIREGQLYFSGDAKTIVPQIVGDFEAWLLSTSKGDRTDVEDAFAEEILSLIGIDPNLVRPVLIQETKNPKRDIAARRLVEQVLQVYKQAF